MRLIDADALKDEINKKKVVGRFNTLLLIDSAETVEPEKPQDDILHKIPKDFVYDTETSEFYCYRNKYTGKEIHIVKEPKSYILTRPIGEWIKCENGYIMCPFCKTDTKHGTWWEYCPKCGAKLKGNETNDDSNNNN